MGGMTHDEMDSLVNDHFGYEARDDIEGVLATFAESASHEMKGGPEGPLSGTGALRSFYERLFPDVNGESVTPIMRLYGDGFLVDETLWTGEILDGRAFSLPGRSGHASFRILHVFTTDGSRITQEHVWWDARALSEQLS